MTQQPIFKYDPDIGYTFIPNQKLRIQHEGGGYLFSSNSKGFRDKEWLPNEKISINILGDSFTAGDGVSNGKRWPDILNNLIKNIDVRNFGMSGTGTDQQYLIWKKFARKQPSSLTIVAILVENIRRNCVAYRPVIDSNQTLFKAKPYFKLESNKLIHFNKIVPKEPVSIKQLDGPLDRGGDFFAIRKLISKIGLKEAVQALTSYQPVSDYNDVNSEGWQLLKAILFKWISECNTPIILIPIPLYQHIEETADAKHYQNRFFEFSKESGCKLIDPLPYLLKYSKSTRRSFRFKNDVHLTEKGHIALSEAIAPELLRVIKNI